MRPASRSAAVSSTLVHSADDVHSCRYSVHTRVVTLDVPCKRVSLVFSSVFLSSFVSSCAPASSYLSCNGREPRTPLVCRKKLEQPSFGASATAKRLFRYLSSPLSLESRLNRSAWSSSCQINRSSRCANAPVLISH